MFCSILFSQSSFFNFFCPMHCYRASCVLLATCIQHMSMHTTITPPPLHTHTDQLTHVDIMSSTPLPHDPTPRTTTPSAPPRSARRPSTPPLDAGHNDTWGPSSMSVGGDEVYASVLRLLCVYLTDADVAVVSTTHSTLKMLLANDTRCVFHDVVLPCAVMCIARNGLPLYCLVLHVLYCLVVCIGHLHNMYCQSCPLHNESLLHTPLYSHMLVYTRKLHVITHASPSNPRTPPPSLHSTAILIQAPRQGHPPPLLPPHHLCCPPAAVCGFQQCVQTAPPGPCVTALVGPAPGTCVGMQRGGGVRRLGAAADSHGAVACAGSAVGGVSGDCEPENSGGGAGATAGVCGCGVSTYVVCGGYASPTHIITHPQNHPPTKPSTGSLKLGTTPMCDLLTSQLTQHIVQDTHHPHTRADRMVLRCLHVLQQVHQAAVLEADGLGMLQEARRGTKGGVDKQQGWTDTVYAAMYVCLGWGGGTWESNMGGMILCVLLCMCGVCCYEQVGCSMCPFPHFLPTHPLLVCSMLTQQLSHASTHLFHL